MKNNVIKILLLEIVCILFTVPCIIGGLRYNEYLISFFMLGIFGISYFLFGFKKDKLSNAKKTLIFVAVITIALVFITYGIGFLTGFARSPYNRNLIGILLNTGSVILLVIAIELVRYQIIKNGNKLTAIISVIALVLVEITYSVNLYNFYNEFALIEFICIAVLPSISKNIIMTLYVRNYGYRVSLIYSLILAIYEYVVPIVPNYDNYLRSIILIIMPILNMQFIDAYLKRKKKEDVRNKNIGPKIFVVISIIFLLFLIAVYSNLFRYWVATIASGSMSPTIEIGDIVVVDKYYCDNPKELAVGDIIVFKIKDTLYTHRIIKSIEKNGKYYFRTKGDYKDNAEDTWIVLKEDIVGKVKFKIKYLGYPSIWLHNLVGGE